MSNPLSYSDYGLPRSEVDVDIDVFSTKTTSTVQDSAQDHMVNFSSASDSELSLITCFSDDFDEIHSVGEQYRAYQRGTKMNEEKYKNPSASDDLEEDSESEGPSESYFSVQTWDDGSIDYNRINEKNEKEVIPFSMNLLDGSFPESTDKYRILETPTIHLDKACSEVSKGRPGIFKQFLWLTISVPFRILTNILYYCIWLTLPLLKSLFWPTMIVSKVLNWTLNMTTFTTNENPEVEKEGICTDDTQNSSRLSNAVGSAHSAHLRGTQNTLTEKSDLVYYSDCSPSSSEDGFENARGINTFLDTQAKQYSAIRRRVENPTKDDLKKEL